MVGGLATHNLGPRRRREWAARLILPRRRPGPRGGTAQESAATARAHASPPSPRAGAQWLDRPGGGNGCAALDITMPVMDGFHSLDRLPEPPGCAELRVVALSARDVTATERDRLPEADQAGATAKRACRTSPREMRKLDNRQTDGANAATTHEPARVRRATGGPLRRPARRRRYLGHHGFDFGSARECLERGFDAAGVERLAEHDPALRNLRGVQGPRRDHQQLDRRPAVADRRRAACPRWSRACRGR